MNRILPLAAAAAAALVTPAPVHPQASAAIASGQAKPSALSPGEIVNAAPASDWVAIPARDLMVMDLEPANRRQPRRVVIQLIPAPISEGWVGNIRKLVAAQFWDKTAINRVQDNYVVQWGDPRAEDKARAKALPDDLATMAESAYLSPRQRERTTWIETATAPYAPHHGLYGGFPVAWNEAAMWPVHCYGMVGVGRDLPPNTGSGAELYTVIGHAPRHLDRNIALVGRVIEGIEHLSSLPRGKGALGFYDLKQGDKRVWIKAVTAGNAVAGLPAYQYLSTDSGTFARYADARANRRDTFFITPAGGADICNVPVPVRRVPAK